MSLFTENCKFVLPHVHLVLLLGVSPLECHESGNRKLQSRGYNVALVA